MSNGQKSIQVCDPNILACKDKTQLLEQYASTSALIDFNQGLDIRLLTDDDINLLNRMRLKNVHFAWDNPLEDLYPKFKNLQGRFKGVKRNHGELGTVYLLTNFEECSEDEHIERALYRVYTLKELGYRPFVMVYDKPRAAKRIKQLQRWCNNPIIYNSVDRFEDYDFKKGKG